MTEKEKALRMAAEQKLSSIPNVHAKDLHMIAGADKDRSELLPVVFLTSGNFLLLKCEESTWIKILMICFCPQMHD